MNLSQEKLKEEEYESLSKIYVINEIFEVIRELSHLILLSIFNSVTVLRLDQTTSMFDL